MSQESLGERKGDPINHTKELGKESQISKWRKGLFTFTSCLYIFSFLWQEKVNE